MGTAFKEGIDILHHPRTVSTLLFLVMLPGRLKNRLLNLAFSWAYGHRINLVWADLKIVGQVRRISLGRNFCTGRGLWLETVGPASRILIADNVNVSDWVHIGALDRVEIGEGCLLGSKVIITDHSHGSVDDILRPGVPVRPDARALQSKGPVVLGENVWLGDSVAVLSGVTIGRNVIVGANSVVTQDIPRNTVWAGVPAVQVWPRSTT